MLAVPGRLVRPARGGQRAHGGRGERRTPLRPLSMMRVLQTSKGVVMAAAIPPATLPHIAASVAGRSRTSPEAVRRRARMSLKRSYIGN